MTSPLKSSGGNASLQRLLDAPLGKRRTEIVAICFLIALIDGFDIQAAAFIAPVIARQWGVGSADIGWLLMSGLAGLMLGTIGLGQVSDRIGRKRVLIGSVTVFGFLSLATASATSPMALMVWRFLTGLGLGGAIVSALAIVTDIAPGRSRAFLVTIMFIGFPLGGSIGGLLAIPLIDAWGWQSVFVVGGVIPLMLLPLLKTRLRETPVFLIARDASSAEVAESIVWLQLSSSPDGSVEITNDHGKAGPQTAAPSVAALFAGARSPVTVILWATIFLTMIVSYLLISWLPSIAVAAGMPLKAAIGAAIAFNIGGVMGAILLARIIDRRGAVMLAAAYGCSAVFALFFTQTASVPSTLALCGLMGAGVIGAQFCVTAVTAAYYPPAIRATGSGWMLGVGRIGALIGPVAGGMILGAGGDARETIGLLCLPLALCAVLCLALARRRAF